MTVIVTIGEGKDACFAAFSDAPDLEAPRAYINGCVVSDIKVTAHEPTAQEIQDYPYSIEPWPQHARI